MKNLKVTAAFLLSTCAASHTYAIDYEVGLSYDTSIDLQDLSRMTLSSDAASSPEDSIELKTPNKLLKLPWIEVSATDKIAETDQFILNWRTTLGFQYGKIDAPSGFYFNAGNLKIDFIEPSVAESHKYKWNMALEAIRNINDTTSLYGGFGLKYEEEKIEYRLGDRNLKDHSSATTPQLYVGLTYQVSNSVLVSRLNCQLSHNLKNDMNVKCGVSIPLN